MSGAFLGQPRGLAYLFGAEMWERFSYYGMRALLVLYMVDYLFTPQRIDAPLGLSQLKSALEFFSGPLETQPFASLIYGLYTGLVYLTPILGGWLADRVLGRARTIALGAALMVTGHFMMAFEALFLIALALIALGCGAFKPNITTQVGELYAPDDARRDRAYSIFYVGINLGAFLAPLVCGTLGEKVGWHYGFSVAGVGMAAGLAAYLAGRPHLPREAPRVSPVPQENATTLREAVVLLSLLYAPSALFWAAFEQQGNTIALFAARNIDRSIPFTGAEIPVTWFQAFNPLLIFLFTPPLIGLWSRLARAGREPTISRKLTIGCLGVAAAYGMLAFAAPADGEKTNWLWLALYFSVITLSELHFSPITLSLVSHIAPHGARAALMGFWFTSMFVGNFAAGWLGRYWSHLTSAEFFAMIALLGVVAAFIVEAAGTRLRQLRC